jgi:iron complex outermembrane receptor protein
LIEESKKGNTWKVTAGLRYDYSTFKSEGYFDDFLSTYLIEKGNSEGIVHYEKIEANQSIVISVI